jgi:hypothetical protein
MESSTCADISRSVRLPQCWMKRSAMRRLAVVDVRDDREVANVVLAVKSHDDIARLQACFLGRTARRQL